MFQEKNIFSSFKKFNLKLLLLIEQIQNYKEKQLKLLYQYLNCLTLKNCSSTNEDVLD